MSTIIYHATRCHSQACSFLFSLLALFRSLFLFCLFVLLICTQSVVCWDPLPPRPHYQIPSMLIRIRILTHSACSGRHPSNHPASDPQRHTPTTRPGNVPTNRRPGNVPPVLLIYLRRNFIFHTYPPTPLLTNCTFLLCSLLLHNGSHPLMIRINVFGTVPLSLLLLARTL